MKLNRKALIAAILSLSLMAQSASACTVIAVGKKASVDGSAMITHNDDSRTANSRLYIVPEADWPEGSMRPIIKDQHGYPGEQQQLDETPQVKHTYRYFASRYSFMNEKGVAMSESTNSVDDTDERALKVKQIMETDALGSLDAWSLQDIALERASSAREAVEIMGKLVDELGFYDASETMPITDGNEVWIFEVYGNNIWAAWRMPDDHIFVGANRARLRNLNLDDKENVMACANIVDFAVENGFIEKDKVDRTNFSPADIYCPSTELYSTRREWRVLTLVAPSLALDADATDFPMSVVPDKKVNVQDILNIAGDWYENTPYDLSKGPAAGPWGNPIRFANSSKTKPNSTWERSINMMRTCYIHIAQVRGNLPEEIRGVSWFGYGAPDTTYITPLWPIMTKLPEFYNTGDRFHPYDAKSGWWVNTRVQELAGLHYQDARKDIHAARDEKLKPLYILTPIVQDKAAELIKAGKRDEAIAIITDFAYSNAVDFNQRWLTLGDMLLGKYALGYVNFKNSPYPQEWNDFIGYGPVTRPAK